MRHSFSTFREAALFASNYSRENRCASELVREGGSWVVVAQPSAPAAAPPAPPSSPPRARTGWLPEHEWRRKIESERLQREYEAEALRLQQDREAREYAERTRAEAEQAWPAHRDAQEAKRAELSSKKAELLDKARLDTLTFEQLSLVIDNYRMYDFSQAELAELRALCDAKRPSPPPAVCSKCFLLASSCTCMTVPF
jgi:hypothetical protein